VISIPVTAPTAFFEPQISFFQYQHTTVYGTEAKDIVIIPIIKYNHLGDDPVEDVDWDMSLPYKMVDSVYDYLGGDEKAKGTYIPINVFTAAKQIIEDLDDAVVVEIIDADVIHLLPYPKEYDDMDYGVIMADDRYEDWHMHIAKPQGKNRNIIKKYLKHGKNKYMNGGFNVIGRVKTIKAIIDDVIKYSKLIADEYDDPHGWWCAMYGLNIACHNNKIKMVNSDNCYYPNINELESKHHLAHYSCDPLFNKKRMDKLKPEKFKDNLFYNQAKKWLASRSES
jgi:hypothetical protein